MAYLLGLLMLLFSVGANAQGFTLGLPGQTVSKSVPCGSPPFGQWPTFNAYVAANPTLFCQCETCGATGVSCPPEGPQTVSCNPDPNAPELEPCPQPGAYGAQTYVYTSPTNDAAASGVNPRRMPGEGSHSHCEFEVVPTYCGQSSGGGWTCEGLANPTGNQVTPTSPGTSPDVSGGPADTPGETATAEALRRGLCPETVNGISMFAPCMSLGQMAQEYFEDTATGTTETGSTSTTTSSGPGGSVTTTSTTTKTTSQTTTQTGTTVPPGATVPPSGQTATTYQQAPNGGSVKYEVTNNGDGTYTTRTTNQGNTTHTTTCTGPNSCNTTTTTNNPDGTTATQQQQGDMADICQRNPSIQLCKQGKESSFGGACNGSGFAGQCDGDAIQCAMARKQHELACMLTATSPESQLYDAEKGKTGNQTADNPNNSSFGLSSSSFDTSSAFGGSGSCLADKSIPMWGGHSFDLPLSTLCPHLETFGNLLVAIAFLLAIRIVRT